MASTEQLGHPHVSQEGGGAPHEAASRRLEITIAVTLTVLFAAGVVACQTVTVPAQTGALTPRGWPTMLTVAGLVLSLLLLVGSIINPPADRDEVDVASPAGWRQFVLTTVAMILFIVAWRYAYSFLVPCALLLAALQWIFGVRRWKPLVIFPLVTTGGIFVVFQLLLRVPL
jgi:hypothetical protein